MEDGIDNVKIVAIGKSQHTNSNGNWTDSNDIPIIIDPSPNNIWDSWGAGQRDLFFLDANGNYATDFNITNWNYSNVYDTILNLLPEEATCDEIEDFYESLHSSEYATCEYDNDCIAVWGHCDVGLGGCHYAVNSNNYPSEQINEFVNQWLDNDCMEWVCDCTALPYAQCINETCSAQYCMSDNPAGCFETGCDQGYECIPTDGTNECTPSSCFCSGFYGGWYCTEDCGGGICQLVQSPGDINNDGNINVIDVVTLVNIILNNESNTSADINNDGYINVIDVVTLVNIILNP